MLMPALITGSVILVYLYLAVYIVPAGHIITISRFRIPNRKGGVGLNVIIPFIERVDSRVSMGNNKIALKDYVVYSSEGIPVEIDIDVRYRISDPVRFTYYYLPSNYDFETTVFSMIGKVASNLEIDRMMRSQRDFLELCLKGVRNELVGSGVSIDELLFIKITYPPSVVHRNITEYDSPTLDNRKLCSAQNTTSNEVITKLPKPASIEQELTGDDDDLAWLDSTILPAGTIQALDDVVPNSREDGGSSGIDNIVPDGEDSHSWLNGSNVIKMDTGLTAKNSSVSADDSLGWLNCTGGDNYNNSEDESNDLLPADGDESYSWLDLTFSDECDESQTIIHTHNSEEDHNNLSWLDNLDVQSNVNQLRENFSRSNSVNTPWNNDSQDQEMNLPNRCIRSNFTRKSAQEISDAENTLAVGENSDDIEYYEMRTASGFTIFSRNQDPDAAQADMTSVSYFETTIGDNSINSDICLEIAMLEQELLQKQKNARKV